MPLGGCLERKEGGEDLDALDYGIAGWDGVWAVFQDANGTGMIHTFLLHTVWLLSGGGALLAWVWNALSSLGCSTALLAQVNDKDDL